MRNNCVSIFIPGVFGKNQGLAVVLVSLNSLLSIAPHEHGLYRAHGLDRISGKSDMCWAGVISDLLSSRLLIPKHRLDTKVLHVGAVQITLCAGFIS